MILVIMGKYHIVDGFDVICLEKSVDMLKRLVRAGIYYPRIALISDNGGIGLADIKIRNDKYRLLIRIRPCPMESPYSYTRDQNKEYIEDDDYQMS